MESQKERPRTHVHSSTRVGFRVGSGIVDLLRCVGEFRCLFLSLYLFFCLFRGICLVNNRFDLFFPSFHDDVILVGSQGGKLVYDYGIGVQRQGSAIEDKKAMWKDLSRHAE